MREYRKDSADAAKMCLEYVLFNFTSKQMYYIYITSLFIEYCNSILFLCRLNIVKQFL